MAVSLCRSINFLTFGDKEICLHYIFVTCPVNGRLQSREDLRVYLHRVTKFAVYFLDGTVCNGVGLNGLLECATTGPYVANIVAGFGSSDGEVIEVEHHHENTANFETQFRQDRASLLNSFNQVCYPFQENEKELINLYTKHILPESAVDSVKNVHEIGRK